MRGLAMRRFSQAAAVRKAMWGISFLIGTADVVVGHHWGRGGLYLLGGAMCLTMHHKFTQTVGAAAVAAYTKGREHHASDQRVAPVVHISGGRRQ